METEGQYTSFETSESTGSVRPGSLKKLNLYEHDLPQSAILTLAKEHTIAVDTETGGLDYRHDKLALVQLGTEDGRVYMVRRPNHKSYNLKKILYHTNTYKIFHYALFDLRFIMADMGQLPISSTIHCTKTLMKMVHPELSAGLMSSLREILGTRISKAEQLTDWFAEKLSDKQLWYAASDVLYLHSLKTTLCKKLTARQQILYLTAIDKIHDQAMLEVEGYTDLFDHKKHDPAEVINNRNWWRKTSIEKEY
jgi:ribonuclease D